jgi:membrane-bound metal-dependent hydrolase YbcI (DUF457 family)
MKGFTHFISATALASCVPGAAAFAAEHNSYLLVWGGIFGILPDTLDFKLNRFLHKYDELYEPSHEPDPDAIAAAVARAIERAHNEQRTVNLHLQTIKVGADLWRQYSILFDHAANEIVVRIGPLCNTGKVPQAGTEYTGKSEGRARVACRFRQDYQTETKVSIFSGPSFGFVAKDNLVDVQFIPWHRSWSHSLTLAAVCGLLGWLAAAWYYRSWLYPSWLFGAVIVVGAATHILEDQLGHMGSNLLFPFTKERARGTMSMHSGDALPNFLTVWLSVAVLFWNLYRAHSSTQFPVTINPVSYLLYVIVIPVALLLMGSAIMKSRTAADAVAPGLVPPVAPEEDEDEEEIG